MREMNVTFVSVNRVFMITVFALLAAGFATNVFAQEIDGRLPQQDVSKSRQTPYGLYLKPVDAYKALKENPDIVLIDVRDPMEISFIGHPEPMDSNVPLRTITRQFDPRRGGYKMAANDAFVDQVDALMKRLGLSKSDPVFVSCRSGPRSARAARLLFEAGYIEVWNLVEGFEGSIDPETGARTRDGWRNAGLPWRYKIRDGAEWRP